MLAVGSGRSVRFEAILDKPVANRSAGWHRELSRFPTTVPPKSPLGVMRSVIDPEGEAKQSQSHHPDQAEGVSVLLFPASRRLSWV